MIVMQLIGIAAGFAILIFVTYKGWSVYLASFLGALAVILCSGMPVTDTLSTAYFAGIGSTFANLFSLFIFGSVMATLYTVSGAAAAISHTICGALLPESATEKRRQLMGILVVILASAIICYGGINAAIVIITIYPIAMSVFEKCDIPKRFAPGVILGGCVTFALTGPGSPQPPNLIPMQILGSTPNAALIPGIAAMLAELVVMLFILDKMITKAKRQGERFAWGVKDNVARPDGKRPGFVVSLIPLAALFLMFNLLRVNIVFSMLTAAALSLILFYSSLEKSKIKEYINDGFQSALLPVGSIGAVFGFASVVQKTEAFGVLVDWILRMEIHPILLCVAAVAFLCMLTGGSATGQQIVLPVIGPIVEAQGLSVAAIHRIGAFAATTIDSLPHSGTILMTLSYSDCKMKDSYPAIFITTTLATTVGTAVVAILLYFFPGLA